EITVSTPVIRYTADSRPHAPSAKELAIATMNITYVVESGSLYEVPTVISILATIRFIDARNKSNEATLLTSPSTSFGWKREFTNAAIRCGTKEETRSEKRVAERTIIRAIREDPNCSGPCDWSLRLIVVCVTCFAFLDSHNVSTIIIPAISKKIEGVTTLPISASMANVSFAAPFVIKT